MSKLWEYWKCPNFGQTFGHIWDKCPYFGHIFCYILDKCLSFGHLFGNILDKFQHFRHILDTFWTGVQTLDRLWSQFGCMSLFWQHIGHIFDTFWTHYVQIVSILTLFKGTPNSNVACRWNGVQTLDIFLDQMSRIWSHFGQVTTFWQQFGHLLGHILVTWTHVQKCCQSLVTWPKCDQEVKIFGHFFVHILDRCQTFGNFLVTFLTGNHILATFWTNVDMCPNFGNILVTFWTHFVQNVSILTLFNSTENWPYKRGLADWPYNQAFFTNNMLAWE